MRHFYMTWYMSLPNIFRLSQTVWELWPVHKILASGDNKYITKKVRVVLSCMWHTYQYLSMSLQNIIKIFQTMKKLWHAQEFGLEICLGEVTRRRPKQQLSFLHASSYLTWYMFLPIIIKLSQTVWELWPAEDFGFRGHKYIMKKVRVVSLAYIMPTFLIFASTKYYQNISNH